MQTLPLPYVEMICSLFPNQNLDHVRIIGIQTLLPTTFRMFLSLFNRGLKPSNVTLLGNCYSTSPEVVADFQSLGCDVANLSTAFDPEVPYDDALQRYLRDYFQERICTENFSSYSKVVIMDAGGEFLERMLVQTNLSSFNLVGVEQTTYGYNKLKDRHLPFPVINVGRSELKLKYEAPLVASCVVSKLAEKLHRLSKLPKSVAVIGAGPIGNAVYSFLKKTNRFSITHVKGSQEFNGFLERSGEFDMIIGCTGKTLFEPDDFTRLKSGVVLVCASYSDKEFNAAYLRRKAPKIISCHDDIDINGICLLNCGFPINFDDHYETVDPEYFQITRSLLTTAIFQAINLGKGVNQLVDLDIAVQKRIESSILSDPSYQAILSSDPG